VNPGGPIIRVRGYWVGETGSELMIPLVTKPSWLHPIRRWRHALAGHRFQRAVKRHLRGRS